MGKEDPVSIQPIVSSMRAFHFLRLEDESGISGTGIVAEGVEFTNGKVVVNWLTKHRSLAIYENMKEVEAVHGHNGKTKIVYHDEEPEPKKSKK
jgi:hypothetical protein